MSIPVQRITLMASLALMATNTQSDLQSLGISGSPCRTESWPDLRSSEQQMRLISEASGAKDMGRGRGLGDLANERDAKPYELGGGW